MICDGISRDLNFLNKTTKLTLSNAFCIPSAQEKTSDSLLQ